MAIRFTAEVQGLPEFDRAFQGLVNLAGDFRPVWDEVADEFYKLEKEQFETKGAAGGTRWQPLSAKYAAWKAKHYPGQPIERLTDAMFVSLTRQGAAGNVDERTPDSLTIGTSVVSEKGYPYPRAQHEGREVALAGQVGGHYRLPSRPVIAFGQRGRQRLQKAIQRGIAANLEGRGTGQFVRR